MNTEPTCSWSNDQLKDAFRSLQHTMTESVDADDICDYLMAENILTVSEIGDLNCVLKRSEKIRSLLVLLHTSKQPDVFIELRRALLSQRNGSKYLWLVNEVHSRCERLHETKAARGSSVASVNRITSQHLATREGYSDRNQFNRPTQQEQPKPSATSHQELDQTGNGQRDPEKLSVHASIDEEGLIKLLECPICKEIYEDPRLLPCSHTFCLKCIASMSDDDEYSTLGFECTLCNTPTFFSKSEALKLPINPIVERLIALKITPCSKDLLSAHNQSMRRVNQSPNKDSDSSTIPSHRCSVMHPTEQLHLYCNECNEFTCINCFTELHNKHDCSPADAVGEKFKQQLTEIIGRLDKSLKNCEQIGQEIANKKRSFIGLGKYRKQNITMLAKQLHDEISNSTKSALDELRKYENPQLDELKKLDDDVRERKSLVSNNIKMSREILKWDSPIGISQHLQQIENHVDKLMDLEQFQQSLLTTCPSTEISTSKPNLDDFAEATHNLFSQAVQSCCALPRLTTSANTPLPPNGPLPGLPRPRKILSSTSAEDIEYPSSGSIQDTNYEAFPMKTEDRGNIDLSSVNTSLCTNVDNDLRPEPGASGNGSTSSSDTVKPIHFIRTRKRTTSIALLNGNLYVTHEKCSSLLVFETTAFKLQSEIPLQRQFIYPFGMAACDINNCIYIADKTKWSKAVYRVNLSSSNETVKWWRAASSPVGLSVTNIGYVVVVCDHVNVLYEIDPKGTLMRTITLHENIAEPRHAALLPNGQFVVSHSGQLHRVCLVSDTGLTKKVFGSTKGSASDQLNEPRGIAVHPGGNFIFVADRNNDKVRLLDSSLKECEDISWSPASAGKWLHGPRGLCYDESRNRLYVANWNGRGVTVIDNIPINSVRL